MEQYISIAQKRFPAQLLLAATQFSNFCPEIRTRVNINTSLNIELGDTEKKNGGREDLNVFPVYTTADFLISSTSSKVSLPLLH